MQCVITNMLGAAVLLVPLAAQAEVKFSFVTDQSVYSAGPSQRVPVQIFLQETISGGDTSLLGAESGLFSAGLKLTMLSPLPIQPARVLGIGDIKADAAFTGGSIKSVSLLTLLLADGILDEPGPEGDVLPSGVRRVPLGIFIFTTAPIYGQSTQMRVGDYDDFGKSSDTLTWVGTELDNAISPGSFTISVVSEPAVFIPLILTAGFLAQRQSGRHIMIKGDDQLSGIHGLW